MTAATRAAFSGSIPATYERCMVPMFFAPYARETARRVAESKPTHILEVACGTGVVTQALREAIAAPASIEATDLSVPMIEHAQRVRPDLPGVRWSTADAMKLPFADGSFDHGVVQFGLMFFPDKIAALRELFRVLRPGGRVTVTVWDSVAENPVRRIAEEVVLRFIPKDPPQILFVPFGYHDRAELRRVFAEAGFVDVAIESAPGTAESATSGAAAEGLINGSAMHGALVQRGMADTAPLVAALADALGKEGGAQPMRLPMQAIYITARRP